MKIQQRMHARIWRVLREEPSSKQTHGVLLFDADTGEPVLFSRPDNGVHDKEDSRVKAQATDEVRAAALRYLNVFYKPENNASLSWRVEGPCLRSTKSDNWTVRMRRSDGQRLVHMTMNTRTDELFYLRITSLKK